MKSLMTVLMMVLAFTSAARPIRPLPQLPSEPQQFEIDFYDQVFTRDSTIFLKQELKKLRPRMNFENWDLKRVVLVAKSARGFGEAYLQIGRDQSRIETVDGNHFDFQSNGNYHRIPFRSPGPDAGKWQLHMKGRIKVKKVLVVAQRKAPRRPQVTRSCSYVLETVWGKDIKKFSAEATGIVGSGVQSDACKKALNKCNRLQREIPLTQCNKL